MKRIFLTIFFAAFLTVHFAGPTPASNMDFVTRECPKCKAQLTDIVYTSGNTFFAKYWTDLRIDTPMLPQKSIFVKCSSCSNLFWISEAPTIDTKTNKTDNWIFSPTETDLLLFLNGNTIDKGKEGYIRLQAWWAANDTIRTNTKATINFTAAQETNLLALTKILDEEYKKNPRSRIMRAEIFRELGKFDECLKLLKDPFEDSDDSALATFIKKLAKKKISTVKEFKQ